MKRLLLSVGLSLAFVGAISSAAAAQDGPAGALQGSFLASPEGDLGGALGVDLWVPIESLRLGGFFGVGAVPTEEDARNRVFMPVGASVALELLGDDVGVSLRSRGGIWGGATQEEKLTAGGFVGGGAWFLYHLGAGVTLSVGLEVWGLFGAGETALFAPGAGLTWNPAFESAADPE